MGVILLTYLTGLSWDLARFVLKIFLAWKGIWEAGFIIREIVPSLSCPHLCVPSLQNTHTLSTPPLWNSLVFAMLETLTLTEA